MEDILYTVKEVSQLIHTNPAYVYELIKAGLIPVLKLGSYKVRRTSLIEFLEKYEGFDLTNPQELKKLELNQVS
ncbi:helix-turn-helix domain-containing protein [Vallitalea sp.]|jgi:excisionase family DNA binding protein|uniref:helix-turn-helix domain-containing protein n=1 Tax=Vallitalea sp. TaxID=1882829 RepID=UPI0025F609E0|nr:helix-turn-helix domain-containing protein [Vallitalea sp.]MCT4686603.1 helix-turn-helix domain-containing protein [Vallitalea sp.]